MGAAWRHVKPGAPFNRVLEMVRGVRALGLEACCTLGMLTQAQADARLAELAEQQKRTDAVLAETGERLNIFINVVERYISERRNGHGERASGGMPDDSAPSS